MTKRISDEELERIKGNIDLVEEVRRRGIELKPQGKELVGLCPFHEEKTPSFSVNATKQVWKCFGCGKGGDALQFIMEYDKEGFRDALARINGSPINPSVEKKKSIQPEKSQNTRTLPDPSSEKIVLDVLEYYHQSLKNTPTALAYLHKRGLNNPKLIDHFKIGYSNRTLSKNLLPSTKRGEREATREALKSWGILREDGKEFMEGRLIFPIFTADGFLGEVYGRRIARSRPEIKDHRYLPHPHRGVFNVAALGQESPLILCESIIDALTFWIHGFTHITSSFGADKLTEEMIEAFIQTNIKTIWIAYDGDKAGNKHADSEAKRLIAKGFQVERILLPKDTDINQIAVGDPNPKTTLTELLEQRSSYSPPPQKPQPVEIKQAVNPTFPTPATTFRFEQEGAKIDYGPRHYCLRGLDRCTSLERLKMQLRLECEGRVFLDSLDFTSNRARQEFITGASKELEIDQEIIKKDIGRLLLEIEQWVMNRLVEENQENEEKKAPPMSAEDQEEALKFLKSPNLFEEILKDFDITGMVGEEDNKLIGYLCAISRKLDEPLAVLIQSSSSAGKTALMDGVLTFVPGEDQVKWTEISEQSLYYVEEDYLKHKLLAISEDEGAEKASYPIKNLISDKELRNMVTIKDPKSGQFITQQRQVFGPCAFLVTTTLAEVNEELINRFIRLTIDEGKEQTERIQQRQRYLRTLEGWQAKTSRETLIKKHHNAQRLLKPLLVFNPYAEQLEFTSDYLRNRRDNQKYLGLIEAVAFLRQYQKETLTAEFHGVKRDYINVDIEDIKVANHLMHQVLGRCLDELAPQTRRLLQLLFEMVKELAERDALDLDQVRFTRKTVRHYTRWSDGQLQIHLKRLEELEYISAHQGGRGLSFIYELLWNGEGEDGAPFVMGLKNVAELK